jgi:hypothetical protein
LSVQPTVGLIEERSRQPGRPFRQASGARGERRHIDKRIWRLAPHRQHGGAIEFLQVALAAGLTVTILEDRYSPQVRSFARPSYCCSLWDFTLVVRAKMFHTTLDAHYKPVLAPSNLSRLFPATAVAAP